MKKATTTMILVFLLGIIYSCNESAGKKPKAENYVFSAPDTSIVLVKGINPVDFHTADDWSMRITKDTFDLQVVDSSKNEVTSKRLPKRVSIYHFIVVDTARDASGRFAPDSVGKLRIERYWVPLDNKFIVQDYGVKLKDLQSKK